MDIKYKLDHPYGDIEVYMNASSEDLEYLHKLALFSLLEHEMFPFYLYDTQDACKFHQPPEAVQ